jgi:hypothetical protein
MAEDDVCGLAADTGKLHQCFHGARDFPPMLFDDLRRHPDQRSGFGAEESRRLNVRFQLAGRRLCESGGVGISLEERRGDLIDAFVGALRRQDRRDEQLVGVREVKLRIRARVLPAQLRQNAARVGGGPGRLGNGGLAGSRPHGHAKL